jgi:hypothetical protein
LITENGNLTRCPLDHHEARVEGKAMRVGFYDDPYWTTETPNIGYKIFLWPLSITLRKY